MLGEFVPYAAGLRPRSRFVRLARGCVLDALMVRRLPVLQSGPPEPAPLSPATAAAMAAPFALLVWAVLLWGVRQFGALGVGIAFALASALSVVTFGGRVSATGRWRFSALLTAFTALAAWTIAWLGGGFESLAIAVVALAAVVGLAVLGVALGILGLLWRQRGRRGV